MAVQFLQKQHDDYFGGVKLIAIYQNTKICTLNGILVQLMRLQSNFLNALHATILLIPFKKCYLLPFPWGEFQRKLRRLLFQLLSLKK